jgi:hypothetical protein
MGIFSRKDKDDAAASNQPQDVEGDGPVTLEDRNEPGGQGSPGSNQAKAEPTVPATSEHPAPAEPETPSLDEMNVGSADPQLPRHPAAAHSGLAVDGIAAGMAGGTAPTNMSGPGSAPADQRPVADPTVSTGRASGGELPVQDTEGEAHRAPGLQGTTAPGEAVETDVQAGALRMGPNAPDTTDVGQGHGDPATVPGSGDALAAGTSEEHGVVHGIRTPEASEVPKD